MKRNSLVRLVALIGVISIVAAALLPALSAIPF
jgi:hypothetical protein